MLKVVSVWEQRKVYAVESLSDLRESLTKIQSEANEKLNKFKSGV